MLKKIPNISFDYFEVDFDFFERLLLDNLFYNWDERGYIPIKTGETKPFLVQIRNSKITSNDVKKAIIRLKGMPTNTQYSLHDSIYSSKVNIVRFALEIYIDLFWDNSYKTKERIDIINKVRQSEGIEVFHIYDNLNLSNHLENILCYYNEVSTINQRNPLEIFYVNMEEILNESIIEYLYDSRKEEFENLLWDFDSYCEWEKSQQENQDNYFEVSHNLPNGWSDFYDDDEATMAEWNTD